VTGATGPIGATGAQGATGPAGSPPSGVTGNMSGTPGSIVVNDSNVLSTSKILYSRKTAGGTLGEVSISAQSNGSFTLLSTGNETSNFNYEIR
jgi:hypothetical protein